MKIFSLLPITIIAFITGNQSLNAQVPTHHMTPGLPWTVVDESELPPEALDSATYYSLVDWASQSDEIRYIFRVYFHPELVEITDGKIYVELPRDPGVSEVVFWENGRIDSSDYDNQGNFDIIRYKGNESSHPSLGRFSNFTLTYDIGLDTVQGGQPEDFYSFIRFAPSYYTLFGGPYNQGVNRYGYFIQVVDSIFHPQVSSTREKLIPIQVKTFPNPCTDYFTVGLPELWSQKQSTLTIIQSSTGQMVYQHKLTQGKAKVELKEDVISNLTSGYYAVFIRRDDGEGGVAYANFVKQ